MMETSVPKGYRMCALCVMDTTDPEIIFNENGVCNHCKEYDYVTGKYLFTGIEGEKKLQQIVDKIKRLGKGKPYDCVIGVSGGLDSTFTAFRVKELGLRPLAVHLDNGWDSELAVRNIEKTLKKLDIDLYTYVIDWEEFKDLQTAFLKASTPDAEIPTDHAILATLHRVAAEHNLTYILSGGNIATELTMPRRWSHGHHDWKYIRSIHKQYGRVPLQTFPFFSSWQIRYYKWIKKTKIVHVLNYMHYVREDAMRVVEKELDWKNYGRKHYESVYTRFYQGYILPEKFHFDKRRAHLSTLICSGQMSRVQALEELKNNVYPPDKLREDLEFVPKKLGLTREEFDKIMSLRPKTFWDYPSYESSAAYKTARFFYRLIKWKIVPSVKRCFGKDTPQGGKSL